MSDDKIINFFTLNPLGQILAIIFIVVAMIVMLGCALAIQGANKIVDVLENT